MARSTIYIMKQCAFSLLASDLTLHISLHIRTRVKGHLAGMSPRLRETVAVQRPDAPNDATWSDRRHDEEEDYTIRR